ncbi:4'-phosphopantetheinyl transferase superfamily protein [Spirosoma sp. KNUC1025]|uniref:4'-phosphopantetheinyl transferase family protein n=1 Tax=Spirosoma sp. KNUC1025 TaxID=2894082 RepID=UPI003864E229|nr:4'-phosphopantetheinyl transferase superfamily protein [Spirosoma sp. KNUC1025]
MSHSDAYAKPNDRDNFVWCTTLENVTWLDESMCSYNEDLAVFRFRYVEATHDEPNWERVLRSDEMERANRYRRADDRYRSLYTKTMLRLLVGYYTSQRPGAIEFRTGITNKLELSGRSDWQFNGSHSGDWIVLAISKRSVGVDIEKIRMDFPFQGVLPLCFTEQEQTYITSGESARQRFYQVWTRKEALVKATAKGIDKDFYQIPSLDGEHRIDKRLLSGNWLVHSFTIADNYPAAVAYQASLQCTPRFYTITTDLFNRWITANR